MLSAVVMGLIAMPWLVMLGWPATRVGGEHADSLVVVVLALCSLVLLRDSVVGPGLPRGEVAFPMLAVCVGLPLVTPLFPILVAVQFLVGAPIVAVLGLALSVEVVATVLRVHGLRWLRVGCLVLLSVVLVMAHLLSHAVSLWVLPGTWLLGPVLYAGLSWRAGPLPPERVLFGALTGDPRTAGCFVLVGVALFAGLFGALALFGGPPWDLPR